MEEHGRYDGGKYFSPLTPYVMIPVSRERYTQLTNIFKLLNQHLTETLHKSNLQPPTIPNTPQLADTPSPTIFLN